MGADSEHVDPLLCLRSVLLRRWLCYGGLLLSIILFGINFLLSFSWKAVRLNAVLIKRFDMRRQTPNERNRSTPGTLLS